MPNLETIDMCEKHEVRFYRGVCDICIMIETIDLSKRMLTLVRDALNNGKYGDAALYAEKALAALPRELTL